MLKFAHFLKEANLTGTGAEGERHFKKYVAPWLPSDDKNKEQPPDYELGSSHRTSTGLLPRGTKFTITGHAGKVGDTHHVNIRTEHGEETTIPVTRIKKPNVPPSPHNDEHAVKIVWNHFLDHGRENMSDENGMISEINRASSDPNHPLSFEKAHPEGFVGKEKKEEYRSSYYSELRNAARTISDMSKHPDFKKSIEAGHRAEVTGTSRPELSNTYKQAGVRGTGAVTKVDLKIGSNNISLKKGDVLPTKITRSSEITGAVKPRFGKGKGEGRDMVMRMDGRSGTAQLASSGPADMKGIHYHALSKLKLPPEQMAEAKRKVDTIADIMSRKDDNHKQRAKEIDKIYGDLMKTHPDLSHHIFREAVTGEGKHPDFHVSHIVTSRREE